ncbi:MAG TPA: glycosyltransferase [Ohtaekwangia sp.]|uniref:glycosyltransferase n=1 Tax=Ohtaekwangia sp. TaxID=2066019 RepID=UPI002F92CB51
MNSAGRSILYLSYDGLTDPLGQSQILPYLAGLSKEGYAITIISFEKPEKYISSKAKISACCEQYNLDWQPLLYHKSPPVLSTLYDLYLLRKQASALHKQKQFSIVHCRSYITALVGMWLKKKYSIKFIFDMRGFWADERVEGGLWNQRHFVYRTVYKFFKKKEQEFLKHADAIVVLTEAAREVVLSWQAEDKVTVIPCCVDLQLFNPARITAGQRSSLRNKLGIGTHDYTVLYLGSIGTWYLWDDMVAFFRKIKAERPDAKFLVLTPDSDRIKPDKDFIVLSAAREDVPLYIAASDVSVCFIKPSFSKKGSSATKMAEVLAMGVPVVANTGWGDVEFFRMRMANFFVINDIRESPQPTKYSTGPQDEFFYSLFALDSGIARYKQVYDALLN